MDWLTMARWSPYAVGVGIGVLSWFAFILSNRPLGCSTAFARSSGMIERLFRGSQVDKKPYYRQFTPTVDWEWMLVLGIFLGAFLSAQSSGTFRIQSIPALWAMTFGDSVLVRFFVALLGGILMGFGARWAGGCTSGHGISGTLQLAVSGWLAALGIFAGGIASAMFLFKVLGG